MLTDVYNVAFCGKSKEVFERIRQNWPMNLPRRVELVWPECEEGQPRYVPQQCILWIVELSEETSLCDRFAKAKAKIGHSSVLLLEGEEMQSIPTNLWGSVQGRLSISQLSQDMLYWMLRAILQEKLQEEESERAQSARHLMAQIANDRLWEWDLLTDTLMLSTRWKMLFGYQQNELINVTSERWSSLIHEDDLKGFQKALRACLTKKEKVLLHEMRMQHKNGHFLWVRVRALCVFDQQDQPYRIVGALTDITEMRTTQEHMSFRDRYDLLTRTLNRSYFMEMIKQSLLNEARICSQALLLIDCDRFSHVNDSLGFAVGDRLLQVFASRLLSESPRGSVIARVGPDEFAILLGGLYDEQATHEIAHRLLAALAEPVTIEGHELYPSASIGINHDLVGYSSPEEVLRDGEIAMFQAKKKGRGSVQRFAKEMHTNVFSTLRMESALRKALERQEFSVHYQPLIQLATGELIGFEALLRWIRPDEGFISPLKFIPIAEDTGLINPIGSWVLEEAARQIHAWNQMLGSQLFVNVNFSRKQLAQPNLLHQTGDILSRIGISPQLVKLEITESLLMENTDLAIEMLQGFKELGLELYMDDFGTGYSSLSYLHRFPLDAIKIDRSFIQELGQGTQHHRIVQTILALAKHLGMKVTAEGIETLEQFNLLRRLNCDMGQGYYFSRPLAVPDATKLLEQRFSSGWSLEELPAASFSQDELTSPFQVAESVEEGVVFPLQKRNP